MQAQTPRWYCVHWAGSCWGDPQMADRRRGGDKRCQAVAAHGCVHWMRETGEDDEAWATTTPDQTEIA